MSDDAMVRDAATSAILGAALAAAQAAAIVTSRARVITAANAAAHALLGYPPPTLVGQQVRTLYAASDDYAAVDAVVSSGGPSIRVTLRTAPGELVDADVVVCPVRDDVGKLTSIVKIISPAKPDGDPGAPDRPRDNEDLLRFARGAAHDFKNLLAIITGNLALAKDANGKIVRLKFLEDAERAAKESARIADLMISFARHQHHAPEVIDISDVFAELGPLWHYSAFRNVALKVHTEVNLPKVFADRSGLGNALLNLIINARDAMPNHGVIAISATAVEKAFDANDSLRTYVAIKVRDTGTGMTEHVRQRAFDPFFSTKPAAHGRGLGLATVSGFARQSNGCVTIDSEMGVGTTVTLFLPAV